MIILKMKRTEIQPHAVAGIALFVCLPLFPAVSTPVTGYGQVVQVSVENVAPFAAVSGPGKEPHAAVDGVKQQDGAGEWIGGSPNLWFGWIHYPKNFELKWETPRRINKVRQVPESCPATGASRSENRGAVQKERMQSAIGWQAVLRGQPRGEGDGRWPAFVAALPQASYAAFRS